MIHLFKSRLTLVVLMCTLWLPIQAQNSYQVSTSLISNGDILQGEDIIGSFVYSFKEKISDSTNRYGINFFDNQFNEIVELEFVHKSTVLSKVYASDSKFTLFFENENERFVAFVGGDRIVNKGPSFKSDLEKRFFITDQTKYYLPFYTGESDLIAVRDDFSVLLINDWGHINRKKEYIQKFKIVGLAANKTVKWYFQDNFGERTIASVIGKSDKFIAVATKQLEGFGEKSGRVKSRLYVVDLSTGKAVFKKDLLGLDDEGLYLSKAIFSADNQSVIFAGKYYRVNSPKLEKPSEGFAVLSVDLSSNDTKLTKSSWKELRDSIPVENLVNLTLTPSHIGRIKALAGMYQLGDSQLVLMYEGLSDLPKLTTAGNYIICVKLDLTDMGTTPYLINSIPPNSGSYHAGFVGSGNFYAEEGVNREENRIRFVETDDSGAIHAFCQIQKRTSPVYSINMNKDQNEEVLTVLTFNQDSLTVKELSIQREYDYAEIRKGPEEYIYVFDYGVERERSAFSIKLKNIRLEKIELE